MAPPTAATAPARPRPRSLTSPRARTQTRRWQRGQGRPISHRRRLVRDMADDDRTADRLSAHARQYIRAKGPAVDTPPARQAPARPPPARAPGRVLFLAGRARSQAQHGPADPPNRLSRPQYRLETRQGRHQRRQPGRRADRRGRRHRAARRRGGSPHPGSGRGPAQRCPLVGCAGIRHPAIRGNRAPLAVRESRSRHYRGRLAAPAGPVPPRM
jgi:hypothetical protein